LGTQRVKPELAVDEWQVSRSSSSSDHGVLVAKQIKSAKDRLGVPEQQVTKLRLAVRIEADDFVIEHAAATCAVE